MSDTLTAEQQVKRGPGRPRTVRPDEPEDEGEDVTYTPGPDDPAITKWRGHEFRANVPVRIRDEDHIKAARGNRFFRVGNEIKDEILIGPPKTSDQYRAHVVAWMKDVTTVDQLVTKWAADRNLRTACEVGRDDVMWLGRLFEPKLHQMRMQEGLKEIQVAEVWVKHGVLELPWRS